MFEKPSSPNEVHERSPQSEEEIQKEKLSEAETVLKNLVSEILPHLPEDSDLSEELQEMTESELWFYAYNQQGAIVPVIDTERLREVIATVPTSQEILLIHFQRLVGCIEQEKIEAPKRYFEALKDPDLALLETFCVDVELVDADLIEAVTQITSAEEAFSSENRMKLKEIKNELDKQITLLWRDTKVEADVTHAMYPQFWKARLALNRIRNAVGIVNGDTLWHDREKDV